jgi:hypothetical protein
LLPADGRTAARLAIVTGSEMMEEGELVLSTMIAFLSCYY